MPNNILMNNPVPGMGITREKNVCFITIQS